MAKRKKKDNTRDFLRVLIAVMIIAVVVLLCYTGKIYVDEKEKTNSDSIQNSQNNTVDTSLNDKKEDEENKESTKPTEDENKPDDEVATPTEETNQEPVQEETSVSDEDKALDLAKKQFGTTNGVYFRIEQIQSNSVYIVSVRDNETTRDLAWYTIDVKNGTVK